MGAFTDLLESGGQIGKQLFLYGVLAEIVNELTQPYQRDVSYDVNQANPNVVLSPAELATMVVRAIKKLTEATPEAAKSGITPDRFQDLVDSAGEPPGLESVLQWYRRGILKWGTAKPGEASVANAIATSRVYTYWSDVIRQSNVLPIPAAEMVDALVENQTTVGTRDGVAAAAAGGDSPPGSANATTFYEVMWANGYTPDQADLMFRTRGNPPPPSELFSLYRRGVIPLTGTGQTATTVEQGIYEGATKDKWFTPLTALITAIPSEYYIVLMLKTGQITPTLATELLQKAGYTPTVIAGIVGAASAQSVSTWAKLTEGTIVKLYQDRAISRTEAKQLLEDLKYGPTAATFVLLSADLTSHEKAVTAAITKVQTRFVSKKLTTEQTRAALAALTVPASQVTALLQTWTLERTTTVKLLTATEIVDAWAYTVMPADQALAYLVAIGYTPYDAWVLLSVKNKAPLGTPPPPTNTTLLAT